jgi:hypothetical protein
MPKHGPDMAVDAVEILERSSAVKREGRREDLLNINV